jgi:hypothetical protein
VSLRRSASNGATAILSLENRPNRAEEVLVQRADENLILLDPRNGYYYTLDDVGARIWELADGSRAVSDIAAILAAEYDASREQIEADALALLDEFVEEKLVEAAA